MEEGFPTKINILAAILFSSDIFPKLLVLTVFTEVLRQF